MEKVFNSDLTKAPNFFILGAGKSGTTSLYQYLKQHPEIFMSHVKEPSFFCETFQVVKTEMDYFKLFDLATDEKVIGEASHVYFTDPKSPQILKKLFPNAKFLICLRNPAERAYSLYKDMRNQGWEKLRTFEKALNQEASRLNSEDFKWNNPQYFYNFLYFHSGLFGTQLQRYFSLFDKSQFHIIRLTDLEAHFEQTISSIFQFLSVETSFMPEQKVHNKTDFVVRAPRTRDFLNNWLPDSKFRQALIDHTYANAAPLDSGLKKKLMRRYEEDQKLLHTLCGIRFS